MVYLFAIVSAMACAAMGGVRGTPLEPEANKNEGTPSTMMIQSSLESMEPMSDGANALDGKNVLFVGDSMLRQDWGASVCAIANLKQSKGLEPLNEEFGCDTRGGTGWLKSRTTTIDWSHNSASMPTDESEGVKVGVIKARVGSTRLTYVWQTTTESLRSFFSTEGQYQNDYDEGKTYTIGNLPSFVGEYDVIYTNLVGSANKAPPEYDTADSAKTAMKTTLDALLAAKQKHGWKAKIIVRGSNAEDFDCHRALQQSKGEVLWGGANMNNDFVQRAVEKQNELVSDAGAAVSGFVDIYSITMSSTMKPRFTVDDGCTHVIGTEARIALISGLFDAFHSAFSATSATSSSTSSSTSSGSSATLMDEAMMNGERN